nr:MAG TPA_asm: hypothetical protein [Caudoviricetes sp.]
MGHQLRNQPTWGSHRSKASKKARTATRTRQIMPRV